MRTTEETLEMIRRLKAVRDDKNRADHYAEWHTRDAMITALLWVVCMEGEENLSL